MRCAFRCLPRKVPWIWKPTVLANETLWSVAFLWCSMKSTPKTGEIFTADQVRICQVPLTKSISSSNSSKEWFHSKDPRIQQVINHDCGRRLVLFIPKRTVWRLENGSKQAVAGSSVRLRLIGVPPTCIPMTLCCFTTIALHIMLFVSSCN